MLLLILLPASEVFLNFFKPKAIDITYESVHYTCDLIV